MIQPDHLYTLHHTYTGEGCAMCGKPYSSHPVGEWMVDGEKQIKMLNTLHDAWCDYPKCLGPCNCHLKGE